VENWGRILSGIAMAALLMQSSVQVATLRGSKERSRTLRPLADWSWRAGIVLGIAALLAGAILRGTAEATRASSGWLPLSSVGDRIALVALLGGLLYLISEWRDFIHSSQQPKGWAGWILIAIVAGISAVSWSAEDTSAPALLVCTLVSAGLGLWSAGQGLNVLAKIKMDNRWPATAVFVGLAMSIVVIGGVNWRVWGSPGGMGAGGTSLPSGFLDLVAVWLVSAARQVWHGSPRLTSTLDLLAAALLVGISVSVQWVLPFS
jgi:hypothetical protein